MDSHEYANNLMKIADFLLSRPAFTVESGEARISMHFYQKNPAIAAVESVQPESGDKMEHGDTFLYLEKRIASGAKLCIGIYKDVALENPPKPASDRIAPEFVIPKPEAANVA